MNLPLKTVAREWLVFFGVLVVSFILDFSLSSSPGFTHAVRVSLRVYALVMAVRATVWAVKVLRRGRTETAR